MTKTVISIEGLSKLYRLGLIGRGTLYEDLNRWWARARGQPDPLLRIGMEDHGNRKRGQVWALREVDLEVEEGEILGVIGRNGAGKSTLLKILSRITAPTSGRALIRGRVGSLLEVGTGFHPELTGRENVYLNGTILGMSRAEVAHKLDEIVEFAEMGKFIDTPVKRYSSGMTVRLAFSVAAHLDPEILIVDEVLAVGDQEFQKKCLGKMGEVAAGGRTILFVSHNLSSVSRLCHRAIWINKGRIVSDGIAEDILFQYSKNNDPALALSSSRLASPESIYLRKITVQSGNNRENKISSNEKCTFFVTGFAFKDFGNVSFAIGIYDETGNKVCLLDSESKNGTFFIKKGHFCLQCVVECLPLFPGFYYLNASVSKNGFLVRGFEKFSSIVIEESEQYVTGKLPRFGPLLVANDWKARDASMAALKNH